MPVAAASSELPAAPSGPLVDDAGFGPIDAAMRRVCEFRPALSFEHVVQLRHLLVDRLVIGVSMSDTLADLAAESCGDPAKESWAQHLAECAARQQKAEELALAHQGHPAACANAGR